LCGEPAGECRDEETRRQGAAYHKKGIIEMI
jgi:hypothetical protein